MSTMLRTERPVPGGGRAPSSGDGSGTIDIVAKPFGPNADVVLGKRLREYRKLRNLRLADLSQMTSLPISTLSKLENGKVSPNFKTVLQISIALAVPISNLIGPADEPGLRGGRAVTRDGAGYLSMHPRWDMETLGDDLLNKRSVYWKMTVKCRRIEDYGEFSSHPGEEFLYIIAGSLELHSKLYKPLRLDAGDSIQFDGMTPHAYIALSEDDPVVLMSNTISPEQLSEFDPV